jgi:hypothetical protein
MILELAVQEAGEESRRLVSEPRFRQQVLPSSSSYPHRCLARILAVLSAHVHYLLL